MKKLFAISSLGLALLAGGASAACQNATDTIGTTTLGPNQPYVTPSYTTSSKSGCASASHSLNITKLNSGGATYQLQQQSGSSWTTVQSTSGSDIYASTSHGTFRYVITENRGSTFMFRGTYTHPSR